MVIGSQGLLKGIWRLNRSRPTSIPSFSGLPIQGLQFLFVASEHFTTLDLHGRGEQAFLDGERSLPHPDAPDLLVRGQ